MAETIQLGEIAIAVKRKDIKHVHLSVHPPNGRVTLVAPKGTRPEVARAYAASKLGWIRDRQAKLRHAAGIELSDTINELLGLPAPIDRVASIVERRSKMLKLIDGTSRGLPDYSKIPSDRDLIDVTPTAAREPQNPAVQLPPETPRHPH